MAQIDQISGRQIAAARALLGMSQPDLASRANISATTLKRMEASGGTAVGLANNVAAVRRALEAAGMIFVAENGEGPGVRLRKRPESAGELTHRIDVLEDDLSKTKGQSPQSPAGGMRTLERARKRNTVAKLKNRRTKLGKGEK